LPQSSFPKFDRILQGYNSSSQIAIGPEHAKQTIVKQKKFKNSKNAKRKNKHQFKQNLHNTSNHFHQKKLLGNSLLRPTKNVSQISHVDPQRMCLRERELRKKRRMFGRKRNKAKTTTQKQSKSSTKISDPMERLDGEKRFIFTSRGEQLIDQQSSPRHRERKQSFRC
jgi:hypothetical protein